MKDKIFGGWHNPLLNKSVTLTVHRYMHAQINTNIYTSKRSNAKLLYLFSVLVGSGQIDESAGLTTFQWSSTQVKNTESINKWLNDIYRLE